MADDTSFQPVSGWVIEPQCPGSTVLLLEHSRNTSVDKLSRCSYIHSPAISAVKLGNGGGGGGGRYTPNSKFQMCQESAGIYSGQENALRIHLRQRGP